MDQNLPDVENLRKLVQESSVPPDLKQRAEMLIQRLSLSLKFGVNISSIDQVTRYINWITSLPWNQRTEDILELKTAADQLNKSHYGLTEIKERVLEYLAVLKLTKSKGGKNNSQHSPILCFVGLAGTGKTSIAQGIAQSLRRNFIRIPLGGMGNAIELRGQSQASENAEPGQIIKALKRAKSRNPVILLDEVDRVAENARSDIMGVLLEVLDPEQNFAFVDNYIDYPFDLSEIIFIATANNTTNISTAVLDRLEPIQMPSYTDEEKITIAKDYMLLKTMQSCGLDQSNLMVDDEVWSQIVRPLGFDSGIRSLERTIQGICRKIAKKIVEGQGTSYHITTDNLKEFLTTW